MIESTPGTLYLVEPPACPVHRGMRRDCALDRWTCAGFDGEGCDHVVSNEDVFRDAKPIGTADRLPWR